MKYQQLVPGVCFDEVSKEPGAETMANAASGRSSRREALDYLIIFHGNLLGCKFTLVPKF
jgi:hypothetical protein